MTSISAPRRPSELVDAATLGPLLKPNFDDAAFVGGVLGSRDSERTLEALASGSQSLGAELGEQVSARYEQLLSEVHAVQALEAKLLRNNERVDSLMQAVRRIRAQCNEPYQRMRTRVTQLDRMQQSAEILRSVQRLLYQCRKLREGAAALGGVGGAAAGAATIASAADLPRVALSIHEVEEILAETDLTGIVLVDEQLPFVRATAEKLRSQARAMLHGGVRDQNQALTGAALQVFFNLGALPAAAAEAAEAVAAEFGTKMAAALDGAQLGAALSSRGGAGGGAAASSPSSAALRSVLWARVDSTAEELFAAGLRLHGLQRVLLKKRDPLSHTLFASLLLLHAPPSSQQQQQRRLRPTQQPPHAEAAAAAAAAAAASGDADATAALLAAFPDADLQLLALDAGLPRLEAAAAMAPAATATGVTAATAPTNGGGGAEAEEQAEAATGLGALWAPLSRALREGLEGASSHGGVRGALAAELPRLLLALLGAAERIDTHLSPACLPAEGRRALSAAALLRGAGSLRPQFQRDSLATLFEAAEAMVDKLSRPPPPGTTADSLAAAGAADGAALARRIGVELRRAAGIAPLQLLVAQGCAQACRMAAAKLETALGAHSREEDADANANAALFFAVRQLRAAVCELLPALPEEAAQPMRDGLGAFHPVCAALANPATPLPEGLREQATTMFKQMLRRELIDQEAHA